MAREGSDHGADDDGVIELQHSASAAAAAAEAAASSDCVQIIDFDGHMLPTVHEYVMRSPMASTTAAAARYHTVGVIGCQSSGKSTLLNLLFGTSFETMDAMKGRSQTTQGVWLATCNTVPFFLLDIEGTDSAVRGEDHMAFERKCCLFAFAICDVVVVNMWEKDVGRQEASNYTLLRNVFEVNLQLRSGGQKTMLLFVLRDADSGAPLERTRGVLERDLAGIWQAATKALSMESVQMSDVFDMDYVLMPNYRFQRSEFTQAVTVLRDRFADNDLIKPTYNKDVPIDGFANYMNQIWQAILACKDVDLPSTRTLLAVFRCDEMAAQALEDMRKQLPELERTADTAQSPGALRAAVSDAIAAAMHELNATGSRYDKGVFEEKRLAALASLQSMAKPVWARYGERLQVAAEQRATASIAACASDRFNKQTRELVRDELFAFVASLSDARIDDTWAIEPMESSLSSALEAAVERERTQRIEHCRRGVFGQLRRVGPALYRAIERPTMTVWDGFVQVIRKFSQESVMVVREELEALGAPDSVVQDLLADCVRILLEHALSAAQQMAVFALAHLKEALDVKFHYDDTRVPRTWSTSVDIDGVYRAAYASAVALLDAMTSARMPTAAALMDSTDATETVELIKADRRAELLSQLDAYGRSQVMDARQVQESARNQQRVPLWVWPVFLVLGWNEMMAVLFNPFYLVALLLAVIAWFAGARHVVTVLRPIAVSLSRTAVGAALGGVRLNGTPGAAASPSAAASSSAGGAKPKQD